MFGMFALLPDFVADISGWQVQNVEDIGLYVHGKSFLVPSYLSLTRIDSLLSAQYVSKRHFFLDLSVSMGLAPPGDGTRFGRIFGGHFVPQLGRSELLG